MGFLFRVFVFQRKWCENIKKAVIIKVDMTLQQSTGSESEPCVLFSEEMLKETAVQHPADNLECDLIRLVWVTTCFQPLWSALAISHLHLKCPGSQTWKKKPSVQLPCLFLLM